MASARLPGSRPGAEPGTAAPRGSRPMAAEERVDLLRGAKMRMETKTRPLAVPVWRRRFPKLETGLGRHDKTALMKDPWQTDSHRIVAAESSQAMCGGRPSQGNRMNGIGGKTRVSRRPSGARNPGLADFPELRFACTGLFSCLPSGKMSFGRDLQWRTEPDKAA